MLISSRSKGRKAPRVGKVYDLAEIRIAHGACVDRTAMQKHESALYIYTTNTMASMWEYLSPSFLTRIFGKGSETTCKYSKSQLRVKQDCNIKC